MKKFNVILASVSALVAVAGSTCSAYATTRGLIATVVDKRAEATYGAGSYGNSIRLEVEFEEKHPTTGQIYRDKFEERRFGGYDSVSAYRNADAGYNFVCIRPTGYKNGNKDLTLDWIYNK